MILYNGQSLQIRDRFQPESMQLSIEEKNSTATITVGPEAPEITVGDWLRDETEPGAGIVWQVKTAADQVDTGTRTYQLEHMIQTLKDRILFGEVLPKHIAGGNAQTCTARQAITYILARQNVWQLGDLCESPSNPYNFNGDSLMAALETVTASLDGAQWEYDLSTLPFTLHIRKQPENFSSEMRMARNITSLRIQIDKTRMYTRHYPIGKNNLHISGDYTSKNDGIWGIKEKVETDQSLDTEAKLRAWSLERLNRHCDPLITVTVNGLDLSRDTGEPLDEIVVGRKCRLPLPEYGTTVTERVTKLSWSDKIREPEKVTVTLANLIEDVASIINSAAARAGKSGRTGAKKAEEDHAWFVDTTTHVGMVAEAVAGPGAAEDWSRVSEVIVDGQGIHQRVTKTEGEVVAAWAAIEVLDDKIDLEVANAKSDMFSHVEQTASHIRSEVNASKSTIFSTIMQTATNIYTQVGNAKSDTYSKIEQTASSIESTVASAKSSLWSGIMQTSTQISLKVSKNGVVSAINQTAETILIQASKINLSGYVTATELDANYISTILSDTSVLSTRYMYSRTVDCLNFTQDEYDCYVPDAIMALQLAKTGNTYYLQKKHFYSTDWANVGSFSRAVDSASWEWVGGYPKVTLSPQSQSFNGTGLTLDGITYKNKTWAQNKKSFTADFYVYDTNGNEPYTDSLQIDTEDSWNAGNAAGITTGWENYYDSSYWKQPGDNSGTCLVPKRDGSGSETWFTLSVNIPSQQIYTTDRNPRGTKLTTLRDRFIQAQSDSEYVCFRVDCGGVEKWYYMEP